MRKLRLFFATLDVPWLLLALPVLLTVPVLLDLVVMPAQVQQSRAPLDVHALGPQVGERVPDFSLPDQNGQMWTLDSIMGEKGALILFHRSAEW